MIFLALLLGLRRSGGKHALAGGVLLLVALLLVSWLGVREALDRFASLQPLEATSSKRFSMARDTWHIFLDHPGFGTGLGTFQSVYPRYETLYDGKIVNHAHNDYLEALAETGIAGGLCCAWFLLLLVLQGLNRILKPDAAAAALQTGGLAGCVGLLVHSLVDFNLHIPSNALLFFLLAALATSELRRAPSRFNPGNH
jgi:O-antigen ligase